MIVTVQLEEHDTLDAPTMDTWPLTRAILEAIEPGAGGHCVARHYSSDGGTTTRHFRLGVTIEIVPAPRPLPHLPREMGNMGGHKR